MHTDARRHVNKLCLAAGVPLVESGTAGYYGQVQPILKVRAELCQQRHYALVASLFTTVKRTAGY